MLGGQLLQQHQDASFGMVLQGDDALDPDFVSLDAGVEFDVVVGFDPKEKQFAVVGEGEQQLGVGRLGADVFELADTLGLAVGDFEGVEVRVLVGLAVAVDLEVGPRSALPEVGQLGKGLSPHHQQPQLINRADAIDGLSLDVLPLRVLALQVHPVKVAIVGEDGVVSADEHGRPIIYALLGKGIEFDNLLGVEAVDGIDHEAISHQHVDSSAVRSDVEDGLGGLHVNFIELLLLGKARLVVDSHPHRLKHLRLDGRIRVENELIFEGLGLVFGPVPFPGFGFRHNERLLHDVPVGLGGQEVGGDGAAVLGGARVLLGNAQLPGDFFLQGGLAGGVDVSEDNHVRDVESDASPP